MRYYKIFNIGNQIFCQGVYCIKLDFSVKIIVTKKQEH